MYTKQLYIVNQLSLAMTLVGMISLITRDKLVKSLHQPIFVFSVSFTYIMLDNKYMFYLIGYFSNLFLEFSSHANPRVLAVSKIYPGLFHNNVIKSFTFACVLFFTLHVYVQRNDFPNQQLIN